LVAHQGGNDFQSSSGLKRANFAPEPYLLCKFRSGFRALRGAVWPDEKACTPRFAAGCNFRGFETGLIRNLPPVFGRCAALMSGKDLPFMQRCADIYRPDGFCF
jgi:hypothetical protein